MMKTDDELRQEILDVITECTNNETDIASLRRSLIHAHEIVVKMSDHNQLLALYMQMTMPEDELIAFLEMPETEQLEVFKLWKKSSHVV